MDTSMSADIVSLNGNALSENGADTGIVEFFRALTAQAERGEIRAAAVATVSPNQDIFTGIRGTVHRHLLVAATVYLQHDLAKGADG